MHPLEGRLAARRRLGVAPQRDATRLIEQLGDHGHLARLPKDLPVLRIDDDLQSLDHIAQFTGHGVARQTLLGIDTARCAA